uniref:F-box domain-containing protein n=1 Tax=Schizophyllum commune (strain H4-8 / FGSC 9210) TaxID=578458 RepID=D8QEY4_SCHCM
MAFQQSPSLAVLSPSILINLMHLMDPLDIIRLRQTCKTLYSATKKRAVWVDQMKTRSSKTTRRRASLASPDSAPDDEFRSVCLVPGGRFLLCCSLHNIYIYYLDVGGTSERKVALILARPIKSLLALSAHPEGCDYDFEIRECYRAEKEDIFRFISVMKPHTYLNERFSVRAKEVHPGAIIHLCEVAVPEDGEAGLKILARLADDLLDSHTLDIHAVTADLVVVSAGNKVVLWRHRQGTVAIWWAFEHRLGSLNGVFVVGAHALAVCEFSQAVIFRIPEFLPLGPGDALPVPEWNAEPVYSINVDLEYPDNYATPRPWYHVPSSLPAWDFFAGDMTVRWSRDSYVAHLTYVPCMDDNHVILAHRPYTQLVYAAYAYPEADPMQGAGADEAGSTTTYGVLTAKDPTSDGANDVGSFSLCAASGRVAYVNVMRDGLMSSAIGTIRKGSKKITVVDYLRQ